MREFVIDGNRFATLSEFFAEIDGVFALETESWGHNLDAFNDILSWFGEEGSYRIVWRNADLSEVRLGYDETVAWLTERMRNAHPSNRLHIAERLADAERRTGETLFDQIVEIIRQNRGDAELLLE
ncbi:MAG: barstar family protein [Fibrella sp.]|nr:barstar family protein [Armatimonadota bacterium]